MVMIMMMMAIMMIFIMINMTILMIWSGVAPNSLLRTAHHQSVTGQVATIVALSMGINIIVIILYHLLSSSSCFYHTLIIIITIKPTYQVPNTDGAQSMGVNHHHLNH